jgi:F-type H+-transporting ATPase subunit epsilon
VSKNSGTIKLEILGPVRPKETLEVRKVLLPGADGVFTVLKDHTPLLSTLAPGVVVGYDDAGKEHYFAVTGGCVTVTDNTVTVLAEFFEAGQEIDLARAKAAHERTERRLTKNTDDLDVARAEYALGRAIARIGASTKHI